LRNPITEGELNLLDLKIRNKAINIMWLKTYLDFSLKRPEWATIMNLIIEVSAPKGLVKKAIITHSSNNRLPQQEGMMCRK